MPTMIPISEAKGRLSELVQAVRDDLGSTVLLMKHGRPAAVVVDAQYYAELLDQLDDAEDRLALLEPDDDVVDFDAVFPEPSQPVVVEGKRSAKAGAAPTKAAAKTTTKTASGR